MYWQATLINKQQPQIYNMFDFLKKQIKKTVEKLTQKVEEKAEKRAMKTP